MPIIKKEDWEKWVKTNALDPYSNCCVEVARKVMELLDDNNHKKFNANEIVGEADRLLDAGITGFMSGCVAQMVSHCHSRGEEFRKKWNKETQIEDEGDKANEGKGVLNPALLSIGKKE